MKVYILTSEQAQLLQGRSHKGGMYNPVPVGDGTFFISKGEVLNTTDPDLFFVHSLDIVDYTPNHE